MCPLPACVLVCMCMCLIVCVTVCKLCTGWEWLAPFTALGGGSEDALMKLWCWLLWNVSHAHFKQRRIMLSLCQGMLIRCHKTKCLYNFVLRERTIAQSCSLELKLRMLSCPCCRSSLWSWESLTPWSYGLFQLFFKSFWTLLICWQFCVDLHWPSGFGSSGLRLILGLILGVFNLLLFNLW